MKLPRRRFLAAGAAALPVVPRIAWAQAYPTLLGQRGPRHTGATGLARAQEHPAHGALYRAVAASVQGLLAIGGGYALANAGHDTRALQAWLGHKNIQHTVRYTELSPHRFKDFWR
jgi:integrase